VTAGTAQYLAAKHRRAARVDRVQSEKSVWMPARIVPE